MAQATCRFPRTSSTTSIRLRCSPVCSGSSIHLELLQNEAVRAFGISFRDFVILATLRKEPAPHQLAVSQIAGYVLRPMGSITQGLDRVERAGLISRTMSPDDRRKVLVSLTAEGRSFADEALASYDAIRRRVLDRLGGDDLERIDGAITELLAALDADYLEARRSGANEPTTGDLGGGARRRG